MSVCTRCWRTLLSLPASRGVSAHYVTRAFSKTARRPRAPTQLPVFAEASDPELSKLLQTIREQILIPAFLNTQQRELILKEKWRSVVENEDLTAEIGGEVVPLRHIGLLPRKRPMIMRAIELSKTEEDWRNVLKIFRGLRQSRLGDGNMSNIRAKFVRMAIDKSMLNIVMSAVAGVASTGVSLSDADVLRLILINGTYQRAMASEWTPEATEEAFKRATLIVQMMESPGHWGKSGQGANGALAQPWVMGVLLEATAMRQKVLFNGKDHDGLVALYLQRLLNMGRERLAEWFEEGIGSATTHRRTIIRREQAKMLMPLWHGLGLTEEVLGTSHDSIHEVRDFRNHVAQLIQEALNYVILETEQDKAELLQKLGSGSAGESSAWENFL